MNDRGCTFEIDQQRFNKEQGRLHMGYNAAFKLRKAIFCSSREYALYNKKGDIFMAYCSKCGVQLDENAQFCTACGAKTKQNTPKSSVAEPAPALVQSAERGSAAKGGKDSKKTIRFIGIAAILLIVFLIVWMATGKTCDFCDKAYHGASYYDAFDPNIIMCEQCAKEYYAPLPYKQYRV